MTTGQPARGAPSLANVDAIFFLGHREIELDPEQRADLMSFIKDDGKGFVAGHTATTAFMSWPEFGEMLGGRFDNHPWGSVHAPVINEDPNFPATKHLPGVFELTDGRHHRDTAVLSGRSSRRLLARRLQRRQCRRKTALGR